MKQESLVKPIILSFAAALLLYGIAYTFIEHRRNRLGAWEATFALKPDGTPRVVVNHAALGITNVQIVFPEQSPPDGFAEKTIVFNDPKPVPFDVPFGRCLFMDTTFLPGTIALDLFGHEIEFIPRALTLDKRERPWRSGDVILLPAAPANPTQSSSPANWRFQWRIALRGGISAVEE